uniref:50S ribosomal protein L3 N(5)-glutamine methyltransferase n=1 Tax=Cephaloticoccus sp. TaxID=1985742 RepID=UPI004049CD12
MRAPSTDPLAGTQRLTTPGAWLKFAEWLYAEQDLALGQIATSAHDEALYLILHTLEIPMDSDESVLTQKLTTTQRSALTEVFRRRVVEHTPAAYITHEAWLNDLRFYVDERVLIPRSYFLEIIPEHLDVLLPKDTPITHVVDVCTGSGCLAILLAKHFPKALVDGVDLSPDALEVAKINVLTHKLTKRVTLHASDVFDAVPPVKYDLILSNPPYEPVRIAMRCPRNSKTNHGWRSMAAVMASTSSANCSVSHATGSNRTASC